MWAPRVLIFACVVARGLLTPPPIALPESEMESNLLKCEPTSKSAHSGNRSTNTTAQLTELRHKMESANLDAYIIQSGDEHQSEYVSDHDKRREFISGFTGSMGDAVVTKTKAVLWTDSRYYTQAEQQLDDNWTLMKSGTEGTPDMVTWLSGELSSGQNVSADPKIMPYKEWINFATELEKKSILFSITSENLIDEIWVRDRPPYPEAPLIVVDEQYAGMSWETKIACIRQDMAAKNAGTLLITALDDIAWTLNLRGGDVPYTPVFRSYLVVHASTIVLYLPASKMSDLVKTHLKGVELKPYSQIWQDLLSIVDAGTMIMLPDSGGMTSAPSSSYLIYHLVPECQRIMAPSPAFVRKAIKNSVEAEGLRQAHIRDAVALCTFMSRIETEMYTGKSMWTELSVGAALEELRSKQQHNFGPSFETITAVGEHAAMPHYSPTVESNVPVVLDKILLVDSGGQYIDGTTDVTRTMFYGTPSAELRKVYTALLSGCIDIASVTFKKGYSYLQLEILLRAPLFSLGLDYGHGSTHGIGSFLAVHEGFDPKLGVNFFGSQEPGYYKESDFGMRLENIVTVVPAGSDEYLTFETVTLVPYERNLIDEKLLQPKQIEWLNCYHARVREIIGSEMLKQELENEYRWLLNKTEPIIPN